MVPGFAGIDARRHPILRQALVEWALLGISGDDDLVRRQSQFCSLGGVRAAHHAFIGAKIQAVKARRFGAGHVAVGAGSEYAESFAGTKLRQHFVFEKIIIFGAIIDPFFDIQDRLTVYWIIERYTHRHSIVA